MSKQQTIDGVPRELLERITAGPSQVDYLKAWKELRALLDAPVCTEHRDEPCQCVPFLPAVQAQGEPVHQWSDDDGISWCDGNARSLQSAREAGWKTRTLYAEQQAQPPMRFKKERPQ